MRRYGGMTLTRSWAAARLLHGRATGRVAGAGGAARAFRLDHLADQRKMPATCSPAM
jgi:hypothetical protein